MTGTVESPQPTPSTDRRCQEASPCPSRNCRLRSTVTDSRAAVRSATSGTIRRLTSDVSERRRWLIGGWCSIVGSSASPSSSADSRRRRRCRVVAAGRRGRRAGDRRRHGRHRHRRARGAGAADRHRHTRAAHRHRCRRVHGRRGARVHRVASCRPGREVRLERDIVGRDDYGRLLAYVYRRADDVLINELIVARGYARPLTIAPNDTYRRAIRRRGALPPRPPTSVSGRRAPGSVAVRGRLDRSRRLAQRASRLLARGQAGHPVVRRPRLVPRRQRRRVPGDS